MKPSTFVAEEQGGERKTDQKHVDGESILRDVSDAQTVNRAPAGGEGTFTYVSHKGSDAQLEGLPGE